MDNRLYLRVEYQIRAWVLNEEKKALEQTDPILGLTQESREEKILRSLEQHQNRLTRFLD